MMTQNQLEQMRETDFRDMVMALAKPAEAILAELTPEKCHLDHMAMGVAGEAGELVDAIKRHTIYGKELDTENVIEEIGDLLFYITGLTEFLRLTLDQCRLAAMEKLTKRYPNRSYSNKDAIERADKCSST